MLRVTEYRPVPVSALRQARANVTEQPQEEAKKSPGAEVVLGAGVLALVAVAARRRRP